jgi:hypothetical protein
MKPASQVVATPGLHHDTNTATRNVLAYGGMLEMNSIQFAVAVTHSQTAVDPLAPHSTVHLLYVHFHKTMCVYALRMPPAQCHTSPGAAVSERP